MLYLVRYILNVVVEAGDENAAGGKARKSIVKHADNTWWNEHLSDIEVEKIGRLDND